MQMLQGQDDFPDVDAHLILREVVPLIQVGEHLSTADIICMQTFHTNALMQYIQNEGIYARHTHTHTLCIHVISLGKTLTQQ